MGDAQKFTRRAIMAAGGAGVAVAPAALAVESGGSGREAEFAGSDAVVASLRRGTAVQLTPGARYDFPTDWSPSAVSSNGAVIYGASAQLVGAGTESFLAPQGKVELRDLTVSQFGRPFYAIETLPAVNLALSNVTILGGDGENFTLRNPILRADLWGVTTEGGHSRGIAFGYNDPIRQTGWRFVKAVGCTVNRLGPQGSGQTIGFLSYAAQGTIFAFNVISGIGGVDAVAEVDGFYTKSPQAIVVGNYVEGVRTISPEQYLFNQKGVARGAVGMSGFGGIWAFNQGLGSGNETGQQIESGEGTVAMSNFDRVKVGIEVGSETADLVAIIGTLVNASGGPGSRGETIGVGASSALYVSALNRYRNAEIGVAVGARNGAEFDGALFLGDQMDGIRSAGFKFEGTPETPIRNVRIAHAYVRGASAPFVLANVKDALIDAPALAGGADCDRPIAFTACHDIAVRTLKRSFTAPGGASITAFRVAVSAGNAVHVRWTAIGVAADNFAAFSYALEGNAWHGPRGLVLLGAPTITGSASSEDIVTPLMRPISGDLRCDLDIKDGPNWDIVSTIDFLLR